MITPPICNHPDCKLLCYRIKSGNWSKHCSNKCKGQHNSLKSRHKSEQTCLEKYGVKNSSQLTENRIRAKSTCVKRHGVEYAMQSDKFKDQHKLTVSQNNINDPLRLVNIRQKKIATCFKNHGTEYPIQSAELKTKMKQTMIGNIGVEFSQQSPIVREKTKQTCKKRYGVENPSQSAIIRNATIKSSFVAKIYTFPSGKLIQVQGYEPQALDLLLEQYNEEDIIAGDATKIPVISYSFKSKHRKYFPDIYIPSDDMLIEVKSDYTYEKDLEKNLAKQQACLDAGYNFKFIIMNNKGDIIC